MCRWLQRTAGRPGKNDRANSLRVTYADYKTVVQGGFTASPNAQEHTFGNRKWTESQFISHKFCEWQLFLQQYILILFQTFATLAFGLALKVLRC